MAPQQPTSDQSTDASYPPSVNWIKSSHLYSFTHGIQTVMAVNIQYSKNNTVIPLQHAAEKQMTNIDPVCQN